MTRLLQQLDFGTLGATASRFFSWWAGELYAPLPERVKGYFNRSGPISLVLGAEVEAGSTINLILTPEHYLEKTLRLPHSAEKSLKSAMRLQIERLSPLDVDEILTGWTVTGRDTDTLEVSLKMAKLSQVMQEIRRIEASGANIVAIYSEEGGTQFTDCDYLIKERAKKHLFALGFYGLICALLLVSLSILSNRLDYASVAAEARVSELRAASQELIAARQLIAAHQSNHDFLSKQLLAEDPLTQLDRLTASLPKTAWLQSVKVDGNQLTIVGETANAAELAVAVGEHDFVKSVSLRSVNPSGVVERFEMLLTLKPGGHSDDE